MNEYPRPWRIVFHLAWWVEDASNGVVAGPFGSMSAAYDWLERH